MHGRHAPSFEFISSRPTAPPLSSDVTWLSGWKQTKKKKKKSQAVFQLHGGDSHFINFILIASFVSEQVGEHYGNNF